MYVNNSLLAPWIIQLHDIFQNSVAQQELCKSTWKHGL